MTAPIELPMAIADCGLDEVALQQQLERYRALGAGADVTRPSPLELHVRLADDPNPDLLRTTIETERECCSFFTLDYAAPDRRLTVGIEDPARRSALDAIEAAVRSGAGPARRDSR